MSLANRNVISVRSGGAPRTFRRGAFRADSHNVPTAAADDAPSIRHGCSQTIPSILPGTLRQCSRLRLTSKAIA